MADNVREVLAGIVREYGHSIIEDARRCESLLRDLCPESRREVFLPSSAIRERVPVGLLGLHTEVPYPVLSARLAERLEHNLSLTAAAAAWAVDTWASGLGVAILDTPRTSADGQETLGALSASGAQVAEGVCTMEVVVSGDGTGKFRTIREALAAVEPRTRVIVRPGVYAEALIIETPVEIVGDGNLGDIVVSTDCQSSLVMKAREASVRGLVFRNQRSVLTPVPAIAIDAGRLLLEGCDIEAKRTGFGLEYWSAIRIHGGDSSVIIKHCKVHGNPYSGLYVDGSSAIIEYCDISGAATGINICGWRKKHFAISHCRIHGCLLSGIQILTGYGGTVENCDIWDCGSGVALDRGAAPTVTGCRVHDCEDYGFRVEGGSRGTFERCETRGNLKAGVWVAPDSAPTFLNCTHHDRLDLPR